MTQPNRPIAGCRRAAWPARALVPGFALGLVPLAGAAWAAPIEVTPRVEVDVDHTDNLFLTPSDPVELALTARPLAADTLVSLAAGLEIRQDSLGSSAYARGDGRRVQYKDFTQLNHDEYDAGLGYTLGTQKGNHLSAEVGAGRRLVPFLSLASDNTFEFEKQRFARLSGQVRVGELGRVNALAERHDLHSPVPGAPDYAVAEDLGSIGLTRGALESVEYGARVQYVQGHYSGQVLIGDYRQWVPELFFERQVKHLLDLKVSVGSVSRTQEALPSTHGVVGNANLNYEFTPRTSAYVGANRTVAGYYASAGAQTDTGLSAGLSWAATYRLTLALDYSHVHSEFAIPGVTGDRTDNYQLGTVSIAWQPTRWISIRAYARKQKRDSSDALYVFDATGEGVSFTVQRPKGQ
jgi:hypothetical protein